MAWTDSLRSRFGDDGEVFRIVRAQVDVTVDLVDLRAEADPEAAARAWMDLDLGTVADLDAGPLFRHALLVSRRAALLLPAPPHRPAGRADRPAHLGRALAGCDRRCHRLACGHLRQAEQTSTTTPRRARTE
ncbi:hypothetical protein [Streptomyces sp. NPDC057301]|uniref:hypothetical protein n=1 Tax=Streptomyces sp. NPDC057301 TaxID=3346093 RepID=UPI00362CC17B